MSTTLSLIPQTSDVSAQVLLQLNEFTNNNSFLLTYDSGLHTSEPQQMQHLSRSSVLAWNCNPFWDDVLKYDVNGDYRLIVQGSAFQKHYLELMRNAPEAGHACKGEIALAPPPFYIPFTERVHTFLRLLEALIQQPVDKIARDFGLKVYLVGSPDTSAAETLLEEGEHFTRNEDNGQWMYSPFGGAFAIEFALVSTQEETPERGVIFCLSNEGSEYIEVEGRLHTWHTPAHHLAENIAAYLTNAFQIYSFLKTVNECTQHYWGFTSDSSTAELKMAYAKMKEAGVSEEDISHWFLLARTSPLFLAAESQLSVRKGDQTTIHLLAFPAEAPLHDLETKLSSDGVVRLTKMLTPGPGKIQVHGCREGNCRVQLLQGAEPREIFAECCIDVFDPRYCSRLRFPSEKLTLPSGGHRENCKPAAEPANASDLASIVYTTSNANVATVEKGGILVTHEPGTCEITATATETAATMKVHVLPRVQKIELTAGTIDLTVGKSAQLVCTTSPNDAYPHSIVAQISQKEQVISMQGNTITALAVGDAIVTYKVKEVPSLTAKCLVHVKFLPPPPPPQEMSMLVKIFMGVAVLWMLTYLCCSPNVGMPLAVLMAELLIALLMLKEKRRNLLYFLLAFLLQFLLALCC